MRRRIAVLALSAAGLALLLFGVPLAIGLAQFALAEERVGLQRLADSTAWSVQERLSHDDVPTDLPVARGDVAIGLYDPRGARLAGQGPPDLDRPVNLGPEETTDLWGAEALVVVTPVSDTHDVVGVVRVAGNPSTVYAALMPWWLGMLALAGTVLVTVWRLARHQASRLSRPLEQLAVDAERLGNGDFSVRSAAAGVDEVDHLVDALDSTARRLDDLLARERAFSAEASHQLRTPLTGLRLRLEAGLDGPDSHVRGAIENGLTSVDRLERTIDDLLLLARERRGEVKPTDITALVRDAEREWAGPLAGDGRRLELRVPPGMSWVGASEAATRQVLNVLLDNARAHGVGLVRLALREIDDSAVAVDVTDEGNGVAPDLLPDDPPRQDRAGGTRGMGLALAQRLATAEGGRLVVNEPATITLLLPTHPDALSAPQLPAPLSQRGAPSVAR